MKRNCRRLAISVALVFIFSSVFSSVFLTASFSASKDIEGLKVTRSIENTYVKPGDTASINYLIDGIEFGLKPDCSAKEVLFLVDFSGSMQQKIATGEKRFDSLRKAFFKGIDIFTGTGIKVTVLPYNSTALESKMYSYVLNSNGDPVKDLKNKFDEISGKKYGYSEVDGGTNIGDALCVAWQKQIDASSKGIKLYPVLITDGAATSTKVLELNKNSYDSYVSSFQTNPSQNLMDTILQKFFSPPVIASAGSYERMVDTEDTTNTMNLAVEYCAKIADLYFKANKDKVYMISCYNDNNTCLQKLSQASDLDVIKDGKKYYDCSDNQSLENAFQEISIKIVFDDIKLSNVKISEKLPSGVSPKIVGGNIVAKVEGSSKNPIKSYAISGEVMNCVFNLDNIDFALKYDKNRNAYKVVSKPISIDYNFSTEGVKTFNKDIGTHAMTCNGKGNYFGDYQNDLNVNVSLVVPTTVPKPTPTVKPGVTVTPGATVTPEPTRIPGTTATPTPKATPTAKPQPTAKNTPTPTPAKHADVDKIDSISIKHAEVIPPNKKEVKQKIALSHIPKGFDKSNIHVTIARQGGTVDGLSNIFAYKDEGKDYATLQYDDKIGYYITLKVQFPFKVINMPLVAQIDTIDKSIMLSDTSSSDSIIASRVSKIFFFEIYDSN